MKRSWIDEINPAQREAVTHGDGPLLVVAGAGTGKTKTLACRVAYLIEQGVEPDRILLLTFTRRAAAEMLSRADRMSGRGTARKVWGGTFHAVANRLLRINGRAIHLPGNFTVMDQGDAADMMNLIRNELGVAKGIRRFPSKLTLVKLYSYTVNAQRPLREAVEQHFPWCIDDIDAIKAIFEDYTQRKTQRHVLDYDDLLLYWETLCATPRVGRKVADQFEHILVDEYQDTNPVQAQILRGMRKKYDNIMVVGDDAQSIYAFRAATVRNILDFPKHFPGSRIVTLEQNYRSVRPILDAANEVMRQARERYTKELWSQRRSDQKPILFHCESESQQSDAVCRHILAHLEEGVPLLDQAVLFRASHHSADLEIQLTRRNIPFHKFGGLRFIEAAHIKDVLAVLRILENPLDEVSWFRVLQLLDGIGSVTARRIMDALGVRPPAPTPMDGNRSEGGPVTSPLANLITAPPTVPPRGREQFAQLRLALADCSGKAVNGGSPDTETTGPIPKKDLAVAVQIERVSRFYQPILEQRYENAPARLRDLEQLERIACRYRSRSRFITDLTLDPPTSTSDLAGPPHLEEDWLTLSTIHSAKGCEWTIVHIIHAADGMIPSDMALRDDSGVEEERRLFYVAMTRAKDMLYVYFPLRYYYRRSSMSDKHGYAQLTRFISDGVRAMFEEAAGPTDEPQETVEEQSADAPSRVEDVRARLSRLWSD